MTFPKLRKNEDLINRSNFDFRCFVCFFFGQGKMRVSKIAFQVRSKVHFVRLIFRSRGKFTLEFLEPVQIFFSVFFCARNRLKKIPQASRAKAQASHRLPSAGSRPRQAIARARRQRQEPPPPLFDSQQDFSPTPFPLFLSYSYSNSLPVRNN